MFARATCQSNLRGSKVELGSAIALADEELPATIMAAQQHPVAATRRVTINLRGVRYEISKSTLDSVSQKEPDCLLANLDEDHPDFDEEKNEFYFDRNPSVFCYIWDYFTSGECHLPPAVCLGSVRRELEFWGLGNHILAPCCWDRLQAEEEEAIVVRHFRKQWDYLGGTAPPGECARTSQGGTRGDVFRRRNSVNPYSSEFPRKESSRRERLRTFLEVPNSSRLAQVWSFFIISIIAVSIILVMVTNLKAFRTMSPEENAKYDNITEGRLYYFLRHSHPEQFYIILEGVTSAILTVEFVLRWAVSLDRCRFFLQFLNVTDVLGILPTWIMFVLHVIQQTAGTSSSLQMTQHVISVMRVFRVFRILRMAQTYCAMKILILAMRASYQELVLLMAIVSMGGLVFGHFIFVLEMREDNIESIPHGIWWAVVTMTTVGYGDVYPLTVCGRFLGALCAMVGILVLSVPVPIIANNFSAFYDRMKVCHRLGKRNVPKVMKKTSPKIVMTSPLDDNDNQRGKRRVEVPS